MEIKGKHIHFMGAGGIGVSALAGIALARGAQVSGCDREENDQTRMLRGLGARIDIGHSAEHARDCDLLVYTSAVPLTHPELVAAAGKIIRRGDFLAELISQSTGVGICGTHGKTTTTWMTTHIQIECGGDPTVLVGGAVERLGGNFRAGGPLFVSELDESDGSFLKPALDIAVITNIESEHLAYYKTEERLYECFRQYAQNERGPRVLIGNLDCPVTAPILAKRAGKTIGFGLENRSGYHLRDIAAGGGRQTAQLWRGADKLGTLSLRLAGRHNLYNALAALAVAVDTGIDAGRALAALAECPGVGRRMEYLGQRGKTHIYTDYAHHPSEVRAAIDGARQLCNGRLLVAFQPHLFSRTRDYYADFAQVLSQADCALVAEIYPAREEPIPGVTASLIVQGGVDDRCGCGGATGQGRLCGPYALEEIAAAVQERVTDYDMVVFMGAGDIERVGREYAQGAAV